MKIAIMANSGGSGGLMSYLNGILSVKSKHEINFYCTKDLKLGNVAENINVVRTDFAKETGKEILLNKPLPNELVKSVDEFCPDVVLFACGWIRKGLEKYPNAMVLHNQLYIDNAAFFKTLTFKNFLSLIGFRRIVRRSLKNADGVIFLSEKSKKNTEKSGIKCKKSKVVYFGLNPKAFENAESKRNVHTQIKLLYVSSFYKYKNHDNLFKAVKLLSDKGYDITLALIGGNPPERDREILKKADELKINVNFLGGKSQSEVFDAMDKADIFVYPSEVESTGLGVMEAMARGCAIACSDMSCMPEVLGDAGVYFNPKNVQTVAEKIEQLIKKPELCRELSKKALERSKQYTWENAAEGHFNFFEELCGK